MSRPTLVCGLFLVLILSSPRARSSAASEECRDSLNRAESAASELASYARRLQSCAEAGDFYDDCYAEFRRVKSSHFEYESAVAEVQSECQ